MAEFSKFAPLLKAIEGGFVNHPQDPGGATKWGVTLTAFREEFGQDKGVADLKRMTDDEWAKIMRKYWNIPRCNEIASQDLAELIADWVINSGPAVIKKVQSLAGAEADGKVGPKTLAAINGATTRCLYCKILRARYDYYDRIIAANPAKECFRKGWYNRLERFVKPVNYIYQ